MLLANNSFSIHRKFAIQQRLNVRGYSTQPIPTVLVDISLDELELNKLFAYKEDKKVWLMFLIATRKQLEY